MTFRLPPEWHPQDAVMLTWPHAQTDWAPYLETVEPVYIAIAQQVLARQRLIVICHDAALQDRVQRLLSQQSQHIESLLTFVIPCNDTWARDHGPITRVNHQGETQVLDFHFNGWGNKYEASLDNAITEQLIRQLIPQSDIQARYQTMDFVLEGGGIEVDDNGHLLTTEQCLLNPNRNPNYRREQVEDTLHQAFGSQKVLWLSQGYLAGDDTDSHIDTLARLAPNNTIVYVQCQDADEHFDQLQQMERELAAFRTQTGEPFQLIPLPMADACLNEEGERLPATYANFLVINGAVLVPTYQQEKNDQRALMQIQKAFPQHEMVAVDCLPLIQQFGSLHCISMQLPKGFLS